jgi:hypothetical protein
MVKYLNLMPMTIRPKLPGSLHRKNGAKINTSTKLKKYAGGAYGFE